MNLQPSHLWSGGFTSKMIVHYRFAILIPPSYPIEMAGPVMCAGVTMYSPLNSFKVKSGSKVWRIYIILKYHLRTYLYRRSESLVWGDWVKWASDLPKQWVQLWQLYLRLLQRRRKLSNLVNIITIIQSYSCCHWSWYLVLPRVCRGRSLPVSYTHLTLPTNREV